MNQGGKSKAGNDSAEHALCIECKTDLNGRNTKSIKCDFCLSWYCCKCSKLKASLFNEIGKEESVLWTCTHCRIALPGVRNMMAKISVIEGKLDEFGKKLQETQQAERNVATDRDLVREVLREEREEEHEREGDAFCKECFYYAFEEEIHKTIIDAKLLTRGETVAIGASGGKDSTVLAYVMKLLNERYDYGVKLVLLSVDEGITGYRDDSLETVKRNQQQYDLPLKIVSYEELYGWTMDAIVKQIGLKNNCTFCGVFRRQALDRGALMLKVDKIATGHNADDIAETVIMNVLRGDIGRLRRCTAITTGTDGALPRCKPFKYTYEKEIVMYAYFKNLDYFSTECIYSPNAYRGFARAYIKDLEKIRPSAIIDIIHSGESLSVKKEVRMPVQGTCERCGYISSNPVCKACVMLEGLNKGLPRLGIGKTHKERRKMEQLLSSNNTSLTNSFSDLSTADSTLSSDTDSLSDRSACQCKIQTNQSCGSSSTADQSGVSCAGVNQSNLESCGSGKVQSDRRKPDPSVIDF